MPGGEQAVATVPELRRAFTVVSKRDGIRLGNRRGPRNCRIGIGEHTQEFVAQSLQLRGIGFTRFFRLAVGRFILGGFVAVSLFTTLLVVRLASALTSTYLIVGIGGSRLAGIGGRIAAGGLIGCGLASCRSLGFRVFDGRGVGSRLSLYLLFRNQLDGCARCHIGSSNRVDAVAISGKGAFLAGNLHRNLGKGVAVIGRNGELEGVLRGHRYLSGRGSDGLTLVLDGSVAQGKFHIGRGFGFGLGVGFSGILGRRAVRLGAVVLRSRAGAGACRRRIRCLGRLRLLRAGVFRALLRAGCRILVGGLLGSSVRICIGVLRGVHRHTEAEHDRRHRHRYGLVAQRVVLRHAFCSLAVLCVFSVVVRVFGAHNIHLVNRSGLIAAIGITYMPAFAGQPHRLHLRFYQALAQGLPYCCPNCISILFCCYVLSNISSNLHIPLFALTCRYLPQALLGASMGNHCSHKALALPHRRRFTALFGRVPAP